MNGILKVSNLARAVAVLKRKGIYAITICGTRYTFDRLSPCTDVASSIYRAIGSTTRVR